MTEPQQELADEVAAAGEEGAAEPKAPAAPRPGWGRVAIALAGALLLVAALVGTAPLWAPLLPWGAAPSRNDAALGSRIDRLDAALQGLDRRVGALEARPAAPASDIADLRQQLTKLSTAVAGLGDLAARVEAIDKAAHAQAGADRTDTALVLALLQVRGAVAAARPFAAQYEALVALARARPTILAAAVPLAGPSKTGVASRTVLAGTLRQLAGVIATAKTPENAPANTSGAEPDWRDAALTRLRGLVTIRRIGGGQSPEQGQPGGGPEAAVNAAELALAGGNLAGAVGALDKLTGAPAEAARPWLRMAKERLAVETALSRIEALLVAGLGAPAIAPGSPG